MKDNIRTGGILLIFVQNFFERVQFFSYFKDIQYFTF